MVMDPPDEQKKIHVNPDFIPNKNKALNGTRVHVNPAFFQKSRPAPSDPLVSQNQSLHTRHNYYPPNVSSISRVDSTHYKQQQLASTYASTASVSRVHYPATRLLASGAQTHNKYESNNSLSPYCNLSSTKAGDVAASSSKPIGGKSLHLLTGRRENQGHNLGNASTQNKIVPNTTYTNLYPSQPYVKPKISPYSWTANKALVKGSDKILNHNVYKVNQTSNLQQNASQTLTSRHGNVKRIFTKSGIQVPGIHTQPPQIESGKSQLGTTSTKTSNILVNPKLIQSIASNSNPVLNQQTVNLSRPYPEQQIKLEQATSQHVGAKKSLIRNLKETPKKASKFKVISKTKLVRRRSSSMSSDKGRIGVLKKSHLKSCVSSVPQPSLKFPTQARKYSTSSGVKKRYLVKSRTKLVRQLSGSSNVGKDASPGNAKYTLKTKTKLVRRKSSSSSSNKTEEGENQATKSANNKTNTEKGKKFFVISKTKLVRRRSNSGVFKSNALVRNATAKPIKCWSSKFCGLSQARNATNVYKVVNNSIRLSLKQKAAKGIISKYKINRLKSDSSQKAKSYGEKALHRHGNSLYKVNNAIGLYQKQKGVKGHVSKYKINRLKLDSSHSFKAKTGYPFKKGKLGIRSDRIINIGGILYKSTKTSLRKQLAKKLENEKKAADSMCVVHLRGHKFQVGVGGRTLKRITDTTSSGRMQPALSRVHIGGLTYSRTANGQYELTRVHQARAVVSSAKQRSMQMLSQRRKRGAMQKRNEYCIFFNRFGRCSKKDQGECPYIHDSKRIAVCTRFLRGRCPVSNCPFSHVIDPDKMPVCSHFVRASCTRDNCPYRHVRVNPNAPICPEFLQGHCTLGEECKNQHILVCEEYSLTGTCPRGVTCPLSHHRGKGKRRRSESGKPRRSRQPFTSRKRKASESQDVLGGPPRAKSKIEKKIRAKTVKVPLKRYFQFSSLESNNDDDVSECQKSTSDFCGDGDQPCVSHVPDHSSSSAPLPKEQEEIHTEEKQPVESSPSSFTCRIEETRQRLMTKMEKMKQTISKLELSDEGVLEDRMSESKIHAKSQKDSSPTEGDSSQSFAGCEKSRHNDKDSEENENSVHDQNIHDVGRVLQRPPLPKRLPSYIPLSMDDEN